MGDRNETAPLPLVRRTSDRPPERRLSDEWFDARASEPEIDDGALDLTERRVWVRGSLAGAFVGGIAAGTAVAVIDLAAARLQTPIALARFLGEAISRHRVVGEAADPFGWGAAVAFGILIGTVAGASTRHLHRMRSLFLFGLVFVPAIWMVIRVLLLPKLFPEAAKLLPFGATMIGAATFGVLLSLTIPLRRGPR